MIVKSLPDHSGPTPAKTHASVNISPPATLGPLLETLSARYGRPFRRSVFAGDKLSPEIIILVNGRNVVYSGRLEAPLGEEDEVSGLPMVAGG